MPAIDVYGPEALSELHMPHFEVDEILAVDWDGTMGIVDENVERLKEAAEPYGVPPSHIEASRAAAKAANHDGFFDPLSDVAIKLDDKQLNAFGDRFIGDGQGRQTLYKGAGNLLVKAEQATTPVLGLTHGKNSLWQFGKVLRGLREAQRKNGANGYLYTEVMTGAKEKGPHIADWRWPNGAFSMCAVDENGQTTAVVHAGTVRLLDDRPYSHEGLPHDASGVLVKHDTAPASRRHETVSESLQNRVVTARGLGDISIRRQAISISLPDGTVAFRPLYAAGNSKPGLLLTPQTSFQDLRVAASRQPVRR